MGVVIGIDVGGSTTKIVGFDVNRQNKSHRLIAPIFVRATDPITSIYGALGKFTMENGLSLEDIEQVIVETFYKATQLSKGIPSCADEAQYNIAYPVASSIVNNGFSIAQVEQTDDPKVHKMMEKLTFS